MMSKGDSNFHTLIVVKEEIRLIFKEWQIGWHEYVIFSKENNFIFKLTWQLLDNRLNFPCLLRRQVYSYVLGVFQA